MDLGLGHSGAWLGRLCCLEWGLGLEWSLGINFELGHGLVNGARTGFEHGLRLGVG